MTKVFARVAIGIGAIFSACSPMTSPLLRHETGELLAPGQKRVHLNGERGAVFPLPPSGSTAIGIVQDTAIFQGSMINVGGAIGIHPQVEGKLDTYWTDRGAGWRLGAKTPFIKAGMLAAAFTFKFGNFSGTGSYDVEDDLGDIVAQEQTLSGRVLDLAFPVSYRLGGVIAYTGFGLQKVWLKGRTDSSAVSDVQSILNLNLGSRFKVSGNLEADVELALAKRYDPFMEESGWMPYFGMGVGLPF